MKAQKWLRTYNTSECVAINFKAKIIGFAAAVNMDATDDKRRATALSQKTAANATWLTSFDLSVQTVEKYE